MDPFDVALGAKLDLIRQRSQQQTLGRRGHTGDPLYGIRRIARTRLQLLSARQHLRLTGILEAEEHLAVTLAWLIYQKIIVAYADPKQRRGKHAMTRLIDSIRRNVPAGLEEIAQLGRTLWRRRKAVLAFFDHASNGRHQRMSRSSAPQCPRIRNLTHYRLRSLPHSGALHTTCQSTLNYEEPVKRHISAYRSGRSSNSTREQAVTAVDSTELSRNAKDGHSTGRGRVRSSRISKQRKIVTLEVGCVVETSRVTPHPGEIPKSGFEGILMHLVGPVVTDEVERLRCGQQETQ